MTFCAEYSTIHFMDAYIEEIIKAHESQFEKYFSLLTEWNEKFNLTAITEKEDVFVKHFADSLLGEPFIEKNAAVLDVGAGAGFPSLPIKIVRGDIKLTLADSLQKRVVFLREVICRLGLENVEAVHSRAEDLTERESYDCVVSRAVAPLNVLCEYCLPFVKTGGKFIAYKSDDCAEEIAAAEKAVSVLGGAGAQIVKVRLDENTVRSLVVIKKIAATPVKYPRGKNLPRKMPLI